MLTSSYKEISKLINANIQHYSKVAYGEQEFDTAEKIKDHIESETNLWVIHIDAEVIGKTYAYNDSNPYQHDTYIVELSNNTVFQITRQYGIPKSQGTLCYNNRLFLSMELTDLRERCFIFFRSLNNYCNSYFLSDYVEESIDHLKAEQYDDVIDERDTLKLLCDCNNLNLHDISQLAAQEWLDENEPKDEIPTNEEKGETPSWKETYFEMADYIMKNVRSQQGFSHVWDDEQGHGGLYGLAEQLTNKFQADHSDLVFDDGNEDTDYFLVLRKFLFEMELDFLKGNFLNKF